MIKWSSFGASAIGPSHVTAGKPNQDSWLEFHRSWGDGIVVSDGLGSKQFSDIGSDAVCFAVATGIHACKRRTTITRASLTEQIKINWLSLITPLEPRDCAATCLFALRTDDGFIRLGMLGDGLVAIVKKDDSVFSLSDKKEESFSNMTAALSPNTTSGDWQWHAVKEDDCKAVILCSDGIADDLDDVEGFTREFVNAHRSLSSTSAARRVREMLDRWPTPRHSDDKTIACLYREEVEGE